MKYQINKNQTPLTDGELTSARDFHKLLKNYNAMKIPFYRTGKFYAAGSALIVATTVMLFMLLNHGHFGHSIAAASAKPYIAPPIAEGNIASDVFTVDADSITELTYKTGSKLHIPANAFKDADGKMISGKVILKYREFHDQKDIFVSGIPMTYDSAGQTYVFESAGMMEITAFQDGKELTTNPDKPIKVDMVSNTAEDRYNTYYLDTASRKWINLNVANLKSRQGMPCMPASQTQPLGLPAVQSDPLIAQAKQEVVKATAAVQAVEKEKPMPIAKADKGKTKFHIVVDAGEFPEIAMYKDVRFQVKDELNFDKSSAKTEWEDVKLKKLTGIDYQVEFTKGSRKMQVIATPVVDDKDLPAAQKIYDKKFAEYQTKLTDRKAAEEKAKKEYEARAKDMEAQMKKDIADEKKREENYEASLGTSQLVYRTFSVYSFGTYNCDSPVSWPTEANVVASLTGENGEKIDLNYLNLVEKNRNAVFPYGFANGECKGFKFNPSKDNMLWATTMDGKLAIVDAASFKAQQGQAASTGRVSFKFKIIDRKFKSSDEVKKFLEI